MTTDDQNQIPPADEKFPGTPSQAEGEPQDEIGKASSEDFPGTPSQAEGEDDESAQ